MKIDFSGGYFQEHIRKIYKNVNSRCLHDVFLALKRVFTCNKCNNCICKFAVLGSSLKKLI